MAMVLDVRSKNGSRSTESRVRLAEPASTLVPRRASRALLAGRRLAALALAIALVILARTTFAVMTAEPVPPAPAVVHLVQPGETYWSIAVGLEPEGDVRELVDRLVAGNDGRVLRAGDRLLLPTRT